MDREIPTLDGRGTIPLSYIERYLRVAGRPILLKTITLRGAGALSFLKTICLTLRVASPYPSKDNNPTLGFALSFLKDQELT